MHILAVDDDPTILEILEAIFAKESDTRLTTACGAELAEDAIESARAPFDCILLDIQMPHKSGIDLCRQIRSMPDYRVTPIIMITAMSDKTHVDDAFGAGASDYITKPFDISDVQTRIRIAHQRLHNLADQEQSLYVSSRSSYKIRADGEKASLLAPITIFDVDGLVEPNALLNYLSQLSRINLFGSGVFAISIRRIEDLYDRCSAFEFEALIADVAEAISDNLKPEQFLFSYGGNGTYDCVIQGGHKPDLRSLVDKINLQIQRMDLRYSDGQPQSLRVATGDFLRLVWRSSSTIGDVLADAHRSAEREAVDIEKRLDDFWFTGQRQEAG